MPRQNSMEVTPPPVGAHQGPTKAQIMARDVDGRGVLKPGCVSCIFEGHTPYTWQAITHHHTKDLSLHAKHLPILLAQPIPLQTHMSLFTCEKNTTKDSLNGKSEPC